MRKLLRVKKKCIEETVARNKSSIFELETECEKKVWCTIRFYDKTKDVRIYNRKVPCIES